VSKSIKLLFICMVLVRVGNGATGFWARQQGTLSAIPSTCKQGDLYFATDQPPGTELYGCDAANHWTSLSGGAVIPPPVPGYPANQILAGCGVEYTTGLSFTVGSCTYTINGVTYTSPLTTVTLASADVTNPRIDVIIVDNTSTVSVLTGVAATPPAAPTIDPALELSLTFATVAANASTPSNVSATVLYADNAEWTCAASANFNCASTNNPYAGTKDIEATSAVLTNNVTLVKPAAATVDLATFNTFTFYLRSKAAWPTGNGANAARSITVLWLNGATQKGIGVTVRDGTFGFSSSNTTSYQQISIPTSLFNANGIPVTTVEFLIAGNSGSTSIGFYIDQVTLQGGQSSTALTTNQTIRTIGATFGSFQSGATALSSALTACVPTYISGTIQGVEIVADVSGSATIDVKTVAHGSWTGTASVASITAASIPALSSASKYTDVVLSGWNKILTAGTDVCFVMTSPTTVAGLGITLKVAAN